MKTGRLRTLRRYRLYFNTVADAPYVWSIDEGSQATERLVRDVIINGCQMQTGRVSPTVLLSLDPDRSPMVWLEIHGVLAIEDGIARFTPR